MTVVIEEDNEGEETAEAVEEAVEATAEAAGDIAEAIADAVEATAEAIADAVEEITSGDEGTETVAPVVISEPGVHAHGEYCTHEDARRIAEEAISDHMGGLASDPEPITVVEPDVDEEAARPSGLRRWF